ncbi:MAG: hypothetical protein ACRCX8_02620 [Sarcina sp.]
MKTNSKIQIRQINDIQGNSYPVFDLMYKDKFDRWISKQTYFSLEEAVKWNKDVEIEDMRG